MYLQALIDQRNGFDVQAILTDVLERFNQQSQQSDATPDWDEGRRIDMDAFDQLLRPVRDHINERGHFYPVEDILYEHRHEHGGDYELTLVWLLECQDLERELEAKGLL